MKSAYSSKVLVFFVLLYLCNACGSKQIDVINIGYIGPITGNAMDLGKHPANAMALAVEQYNRSKSPDAPLLKLHVEDDEWKKENAIPLYDKLRKEHKIEVLFISNSEGTVVLQEKILQDHVILINPLNNDALLSSMNQNTFKIGKKTEETALVTAARIFELGLKNIVIFQVNNYFMSLSAKSLAENLKKNNVQVEIIPVDINQTDYTAYLNTCKSKNIDALLFFGYKNLGYAMKQARDKGIKVPYFATNTLFGDGYYKNSQGTMDGTVFAFFTQNDGNYVLANQFANAYKDKFGEIHVAFWSAMQAYDAMNIFIAQLSQLSTKPTDKSFEVWLREQLHTVSFYQGVCGNIAILEDGASKGIYFTLYTIKSDGVVEKVKR